MGNLSPAWAKLFQLQRLLLPARWGDELLGVTPDRIANRQHTQGTIRGHHCSTAEDGVPYGGGTAVDVFSCKFRCCICFDEIGDG